MKLRDKSHLLVDETMDFHFVLYLPSTAVIKKGARGAIFSSGFGSSSRELSI